MSRFYGSLQGSRGVATRCGTKNSGIEAHVRGWDVGVRAIVNECNKCGGDQVQVYATGGSNGNSASDIELVYCPTCDGREE